MIAVVEPSHAGRDHAAVNASLIEAVALAFPDEAIFFAAAAVHRAHVERSGPLPAGVTPVDIAVGPPGGVRPGRITSQWRTLRALARERRPRLFILLSAGPETLFAARMLAMEFGAVRVFVVLHGNLADATGWRSRDPRHRLIDFRAGLAAARHARIRLVVLEDYIRDAAIEHGLAGAQHMLVWPHPVPAGEIDPQPGEAPHAPIRIAFLGAASRRKGFDVFLSLARKVKDGGAAHAFSLIGAPLEPFPEAEGIVAMPDEPLDRAEYLRRLRTVDYVMLLFDERADRLTASGTLIDCVAQARPVIALDRAGVRGLANRFGQIGIVRGSAMEIGTLLLEEGRALADRDAYRGYCAALRRVAASRGPGETAALIRRDTA